MENPHSQVNTKSRKTEPNHVLKSRFLSFRLPLFPIALEQPKRIEIETETRKFSVNDILQSFLPFTTTINEIGTLDFSRPRMTIQVFPEDFLQRYLELFAQVVYSIGIISRSIVNLLGLAGVISSCFISSLISLALSLELASRY